MVYNNEHLNLFHHYSQNGSIPIENNISRGLAIVFQEYPTLLLMFLNEIRSQIKSNEEALSLDSNYYVNFQKRIFDFSCPENIVGVSLTVKEGLNETWNDTQIKDSTNDPITDISIEFKDTIIIIEVKRTSEDCNAQLMEQMNKIADEKCNKINAHFTWTDIIEMIEKYRSITGRESRLIDDYYQHICSCFPSWCPVKNLNDIPNLDTNAQKKRLNVLVNKYNKEHSLPAKEYIDISNQFCSTSELHIWIPEKDDQKSVIKLGIWPSSKKSQYWELCNHSTFDFLHSDIIEKINDYGMNTSIYVYVRIYDTHGRPKFPIFTGKGKINTKQEYTGFCETIMKRWQRNGNSNSWADFCQIIENSSYISKESKTEFKTYYEDVFIPSNMNYFNAVLGCEIISDLPYREAQLIDKESKFDSFVSNYISKLKATIENN